MEIADVKKATKTVKKSYRAPGAALLVWGIPFDVKDSFKATCKRKGVPMQDTVRNLLEEFVAKNKETA